MYKTLRKIQAFLLSVDPLWQNLINFCLLLIFIAALTVGDARFQLAQNIAVVVAPLLFIANLLLLLVLSWLRRRQIDPDEAASSFAALREPGRLTELFGGTVSFSPGRTSIRGPVPGVPFMRRAESLGDIEAITEINLVAFHSTAWQDDHERKLTRNLAMWKRNPETFWVMDMPDETGGESDASDGQRRPFFFSCILPLTKSGFERYFLDRLAGDNDFRPDWIAKPGMPVHCVLLFTFARDPKLARQAIRETGRDLLRHYIRCVGVHLDSVLRSHTGPDAETTVYFQNSDPSFRRLAELAGMDETQLRSRDGERVYVTTAHIEREASVVRRRRKAVSG